MCNYVKSQFDSLNCETRREQDFISLDDLTGIDLAYDVGMEKYQESGDATDLPSPTVVEKYAKVE